MTIRIVQKETGNEQTVTATSITYNESGSVTVGGTTYLLDMYDIYIGRELFFKFFGPRSLF